jgi:cobalt/nickel transport system permease protein
MLPEWVAESPPLRASTRSRPERFIARTLRGSARFLEQVLFAEQVARRPGLLQRLDARAKAVSIIGLIVAASFLHHIPSLLLIAAFAALAAGLSRLRLAELLNRVWLLMPGVFVIVALPAALNLVTPGSPVLVIIRLDRAPSVGPIHLPAEISLTRQGIAAAGLVVTRVVLGVLLAVVLALTTRWQDLLKAGSSAVSAPFILILAMTYRYLFVLIRVIEDMHFARRARTMAPARGGMERRWVGSRIGALFLRSRRLSENVYQAMLARGYAGVPRTLTRFRFGAPEGLWVISCAIIVAVALVSDRVLWTSLTW